MNDDETSMLSRARRGLAPTRNDAERVRYALEAALPAAAAPNAGAALPRWVRLGATLTLAAATGAGGYALGWNAGHAQTKPPATATVPAPPPAPIAPDRSEAPAPLHPTPEPPAPPNHARASNIETPRPPAAASATPPTMGESPLELETRLLARVERSLRDDNPRLALGLLGELEREVPGGQLEEERQAARVIAHCKLDSESAPKLAAGFATRYASSAYRDRIRAACGVAAEAPKSE